MPVEDLTPPPFCSRLSESPFPAERVWRFTTHLSLGIPWWFPLPSKGVAIRYPLAGQPQPSDPLRRDDADHVRVVAEAGDPPFLDGDEAELSGLADRGLDRRARHSRDRRDMLNRQPTVPAPRSLGGHEAERSLLSGVNFAAMVGESRPEDAQRRRRSRLASVRGREPAPALGLLW